MVAVIAILVTLMTAGIGLLNGTGSQSRRAGVDMLSGMIEQARTTAITTRSYVVLAIAEPGDLPAGDERCRIGLFKVPVEKWPPGSTDSLTLEATLLNRWQTLNTGIVLIGNDDDPNSVKATIPNPMDGDKTTINYGGAKKLSIKVHAIAFNPRGGLHSPAGSTSIVLRIAEGGYRNGEAKPNKRAGQSTVTENRLKIGRVTARPYQIDG
jgi:hypothetical protein